MNAGSDKASGILVDEPAPGVACICIDRPERMNALGVATTHALHAAIVAAIGSHAKVIVLTGTGRAFCAGADLKERQLMAEPERYAHNRAINAAVDALASSPLPTIAAINGLALGGGCELALGCDLRMMVAGAQIGLTEARVGAIPGAGGTQRLPRLIGASRALEMILTGEPVTAERAAEIGLVNRVVPADQLSDCVLQLATLLASRSPTASALAKSTIYAGIEKPLADGLELERKALANIFASADYAEGLAAFAEKRPPRFASLARKG